MSLLPSLLSSSLSAKVVLTTRADTQKWFRSKRLDGRLRSLLYYQPWWDIAKGFVMALEEFERELKICPVVPTEADAAACIASYERHNAKIRASIPADHLLEFQASQGWEPLCRFLNVSVPNAPFPHGWDAKENEAEIFRLKRYIFYHWFVKCCICLLPVLFVVYLVRRFCRRSKKLK
eukprot:gnl/TRDRNA2_/TRDRNA2_92539_c0_seq2.p1 gnl/TRDRNA2_/TRDRNA2_92539_c0~~gnl/TRDRNA2_/TRDRNA2_92539_c0_seq2.p1  ORF type:complete len:178 (+),score=34.11 gnl/TRDRNA2_/TRDRNA2_92539_c0_seq2:329-862(+)